VISASAAAAPTTVTYVVELAGAGTRLTLRHAGFTSHETCDGTAIGWETSVHLLAEGLAGDG
jgi:Activator of Hsp90 ATPase homolog 1-like protein